MISFQHIQKNLSSQFLVVLIELFMIISVIVFVIGTTVHWFKHSASIAYPICFILFYFIKFLSDSALVLGEPENILWIDLNILGITISYKTIFLSNVDSLCGLLLMSFFYLFRLGLLKRS